MAGFCGSRGGPSGLRARSFKCHCAPCTGQTRESIPAAPGRPEREDYEYRCLGTRMTQVTERRSKRDWALFVESIAVRYPEAERITLIMDNLNTHTPAALYETFAPDKAKALWDRFEFIHTPKYGSWLNMAGHVRSCELTGVTLCQ